MKHRIWEVEICRDEEELTYLCYDRFNIRANTIHDVIKCIKPIVAKKELLDPKKFCIKSIKFLCEVENT